MADVSIIEAIGAAIASALGGGATGAAVAKRRTPGSPEDHERRLLEIETWRAQQELRMSHLEGMIAHSFDRLSESVDRLYSSTERLTEKVDELQRTVIRVDVETTVDRELRRQRVSNPEIPK